MNTEILEHPVLQKYNTKQIQTLFIQFVENLEEKEKEKEEQVVLHQIDFKDLTKEVQNDFLEYEKNKDTIKLYNI